MLRKSRSRRKGINRVKLRRWRDSNCLWRSMILILRFRPEELKLPRKSGKLGKERILLTTILVIRVKKSINQEEDEEDRQMMRRLKTKERELKLRPRRRHKLKLNWLRSLLKKLKRQLKVRFKKQNHPRSKQKLLLQLNQFKKPLLWSKRLQSQKHLHHKK